MSDDVFALPTLEGNPGQSCGRASPLPALDNPVMLDHFML
jgi:hypothetical protein